jgi:hypothetical protein
MTTTRRGRAEVWRADLAAVVALTALGVAFLFEMVALDAVPVARDIQLFFIPHKHILWESLQAGDLPLWTPFIRTGYPVLANFQSGVFYPPHWLYAVLPFFTGFNLLIVLHLLLGGLSAYVLCRCLGFGPVPAWVGAVAYMLGGYLVSLTNLVNVLQTAAWAPAMIAALVHHVRRWRPSTLAGMVAVYLMGFLAGEPQTFLVVSATALGFGLVRAGGPEADPGARKRVVGAMAVTAAAVAGLAALQVLPTLEMVSRAGRGEGLTLGQSGRYSLTPIRLFHLVLPNDFSDPVYRFGRKLQLSEVEPWLYSVYLGIAALVLAWHARWDRGHGREVVFWWLVAAAGVGLALGIHLPLFRFLHAHLPGFSAFRYPEKFLVLTGLAVPVLAAHGMRSVLARPRPDRLDAAAALAVLAAALGGYAVWLLAPDRVFGWLREVSPAAPMLDDFSYAYLEWGENLEVALAMLAASVGLVGLFRKRRLGKTVFAGLICLIVPLDFWLANRSMNPVVDRTFYTREPAVATVMPLADVAREFRYRASPFEEHLGKFYSFPSLPTEAAKWMWQRTMQPATGVLWDVLAHDAPDAIHLKTIRATDELLRELPPPRRRRVLRLGSVKYVYHPLPTIDLPHSRVIKVDSVPGYIYRLEETLPRAYLAHGRRFRDGIDALNAVLAPDAPYRREVSILVAEGGEKGPGRASDAVGVLSPGDMGREASEVEAESTSTPRLQTTGVPEPEMSGGEGMDTGGDGDGVGRGPLPDPGSARIVADEGEEIIVRVVPDTTAQLVLTDTWYPGWHAYVDGEERPLRRANYFFKSVGVRPGDETVVFRYRSEPLRRGAVISAGSLALLLAGLGFWRFRRRRVGPAGDSAGTGREP